MDEHQDIPSTRSPLKDLSAIANIQSPITQNVDNLQDTKEDSPSTMGNIETNNGEKPKVLTHDTNISPISTVKFETDESRPRLEQNTSISSSDNTMDLTESDYGTVYEEHSTILHLCDDMNKLILHETGQETEVVMPSIENQSTLDMHTFTLKVSPILRDASVASDKQDRELFVPQNTPDGVENKYSQEQETNSSLLEKQTELLDSLQKIFKTQICCELKTADVFDVSEMYALDKSEEQTAEADTVHKMDKTFPLENKMYDANLSIENESLSEFILDDEIQFEHCININISELIIKQIIEEIIDSVCNFQIKTTSALQSQHTSEKLDKSTINVESIELANAEGISEEQVISGDVMTEDCFTQQTCDLLNSADFDFLMKKGGSKSEKKQKTQSSILESFDPFFAQCSPLQQAKNISSSLVEDTVDKDCIVYDSSGEKTVDVIDTTINKENSNNDRPNVLVDFGENLHTSILNEPPVLSELCEKSATERKQGAIKKTLPSSKLEHVSKSEYKKYKLDDCRKEEAALSIDMLSTEDSNNTLVDNICSILENLPTMDVKKAVDEVDKIKLFLGEKVKQDDLVIAEKKFQRHIVAQKQEESETEIYRLKLQIQEYDNRAFKMKKTINEYSQITNKLANDINGLKKERDEAKQHLQSVEMALADVQLKFEKSAEAIWMMKSKQELALQTEVDLVKKFAEGECNYKTLKTEAMNRLQQCNEEYGKAINSHNRQVMVLETMIKKSKVKIASLERQLKQRLHEQIELSEMCDKLVESVENDEL